MRFAIRQRSGLAYWHPTYTIHELDYSQYRHFLPVIKRVMRLAKSVRTFMAILLTGCGVVYGR
jgi:hypothetical protein